MTAAEEAIHEFALAEVARLTKRADLLRRAGDHLAQVAMRVDCKPASDIALQAAVEGWLLVATGYGAEA